MEVLIFFLLFKFSSFNRFSIISKINYYGKSVRNQRSHNQKPPIDMWISLKKKDLTVHFRSTYSINLIEQFTFCTNSKYYWIFLLFFFVGKSNLKKRKINSVWFVIIIDILVKKNLLHLFGFVFVVVQKGMCAQQANSFYINFFFFFG